jgi:hypothetical protein
MTYFRPDDSYVSQDAETEALWSGDHNVEY